MRAAREAWILQYLGHPQVRLLHGGLAAWREAGCELTAEAADDWTVGLRVRLQAGVVIGYDEIAGCLGRDGITLLDVRDADEHAGRDQTACCARRGAIPGAVWIEWTQFLEGGRFKSPDAIRGLLRESGVDLESEIVPYCHRGARSANTYYAWKHAGSAESATTSAPGTSGPLDPNCRSSDRERVAGRVAPLRWYWAPSRPQPLAAVQRFELLPCSVRCRIHCTVVARCLRGKLDHVTVRVAEVDGVNEFVVRHAPGLDSRPPCPWHACRAGSSNRPRGRCAVVIVLGLELERHVRGLEKRQVGSRITEFIERMQRFGPATALCFLDLQGPGEPQIPRKPS